MTVTGYRSYQLWNIGCRGSTSIPRSIWGSSRTSRCSIAYVWCHEWDHIYQHPQVVWYVVFRPSSISFIVLSFHRQASHRYWAMWFRYGHLSNPCSSVWEQSRYYWANGCARNDYDIERKANAVLRRFRQDFAGSPWTTSMVGKKAYGKW